MTTPAPLVIKPLQWASLPDLDEAGPLDASDRACMSELAAVLARHGKLDRFALHLAHRHFDLAVGEVLVERSDHDGRSQRITVERLDGLADAVPTTWMLDTAPDMLATDAVYCVCIVPPFKEACVRHGKSAAPPEKAVKEERIRDRRIAEDKWKHEQGFPVAGHDPRNRDGGRER